MLAEERKEVIISRLEKSGSMSTKELLEVLGISSMTLWRDINSLEKQGVLKRIHGGITAIKKPKRSGIAENTVSVKRLINEGKKLALAEYAVRNFISPGDIITLEGGTTVASIVQFLEKLAETITILTNSMYICNLVTQFNYEYNLVCSGGILRKISNTFVGPSAQAFFNSHKSNILFISSAGFDNETGLTDPNPLEVQVKQNMIQNADKVIALLDSSKFDVHSLMKVVDFKDIDIFVTDSCIKPEDKAFLMTAGFDLRVVEL
ncbi:DeoR/GlpR family DNA-binding transcription regulator [Lentisphaerota bacterium ZTH]|nr:DeoR/GlpR transcriptional regulator [Lentisphaerota bacterium]WET05242.1 DeoR/GlpR family DNA-binding transcription regulator [Lentisphaerota bacterium ZTH]